MAGHAPSGCEAVGQKPYRDRVKAIHRLTNVASSTPSTAATSPFARTSRASASGPQVSTMNAPMRAPTS